MLYRVRIYKAFKGRAGTRNQWSNEYAIESNEALDSDGMVSQVQRMVAFEKAFHLQNIDFMRAVVSTYARESSRSDPNAFRVIELNGTGVADLPPTTETNILAITLRVKFGAVTGRGGMKYYRGCVTEAMITAGSDGAPTLVHPPYAFTDNASGLLTALGQGVLVTPNTKAANGAPSHPVTQISIAGISIHKQHNRRKKKEVHNSSAMIDALKTAVEIAAAAGAFYLTKGRSESPVGKLAMQGAAALAARAFNGLVDQLTDGVDGPIPGPV